MSFVDKPFQLTAGNIHQVFKNLILPRDIATTLTKLTNAQLTIRYNIGSKEPEIAIEHRENDVLQRTNLQEISAISGFRRHVVAAVKEADRKKEETPKKLVANWLLDGQRVSGVLPSQHLNVYQGTLKNLEKLDEAAERFKTYSEGPFKDFLMEQVNAVKALETFRAKQALNKELITGAKLQSALKEDNILRWTYDRLIGGNFPEQEAIDVFFPENFMNGVSFTLGELDEDMMAANIILMEHIGIMHKTILNFYKVLEEPSGNKATKEWNLVWEGYKWTIPSAKDVYARLNKAAKIGRVAMKHTTHKSNSSEISMNVDQMDQFNYWFNMTHNFVIKVRNPKQFWESVGLQLAVDMDEEADSILSQLAIAVNANVVLTDVVDEEEYFATSIKFIAHKMEIFGVNELTNFRETVANGVWPKKEGDIHPNHGLSLKLTDSIKTFLGIGKDDELTEEQRENFIGVFRNWEGYKILPKAESLGALGEHRSNELRNYLGLGKTRRGFRGMSFMGNPIHPEVAVILNQYDSLPYGKDVKGPTQDWVLKNFHTVEFQKVAVNLVLAALQKQDFTENPDEEEE